MSSNPPSPPPPSPAPTPPVSNLNIAPPTAQPSNRDSKAEPKSQGKAGFRKRLPIWLQEMPRIRFEPPAPDPNYQLIDREDLEEELKDIPAEVKAEIIKDMEFMEYELMRLFRQRDHEAKKQQNRYRRVQISYLLLAALATMIGSVQAITFSTAPETMPLFAFFETVVALLATFLATVSGRESPLPMWLTNRRRAEQLRREYFRYLTHMAPYDEVDEGYQRRMLLAKRAADINRGVYPQEVDPRSGTGNS
jgi:hypothetical protein